MKNKTVSVTFMLLCILFCTCLITANFLETKVIQLGFVTFTAGMLVFPISYIINDCIAGVFAELLCRRGWTNRSIHPCRSVLGG